MENIANQDKTVKNHLKVKFTKKKFYDINMCMTF